ncbi:Dps family protein [Roseibium limicola]|uniref:DNA starvation/stationary phase protection protein n=1 Tax=Roseibium limicola TaxID=2816037 RepID=A0A939JAE4_9HYPH|nr:Dps family protein [Roseibium limicola]MBO0347346.1 DNA starvation/stationary phase protection protein [Roseibium limicola]
MTKSNVLNVTPKNAEPLKTGIEAEAREQIAKHLSVALARTYILVVKSHLYHWNVVGPLFKSIHDLTEEHYENLFAAADEIAERIRALGFQAPVEAADFGVELGEVLPKGKMPNAAGMIENLVKDHEAIAAQFRDIASYAGDQDDLVTEDMLTARIAFHEQASWMLRALIAE